MPQRKQKPNLADEFALSSREEARIVSMARKTGLPPDLQEKQSEAEKKRQIAKLMELVEHWKTIKAMLYVTDFAEPLPLRYCSRFWVGRITNVGAEQAVFGVITISHMQFLVEARNAPYVQVLKGMYRGFPDGQTAIVGRLQLNDSCPDFPQGIDMTSEIQEALSKQTGIPDDAGMESEEE